MSPDVRGGAEACLDAGLDVQTIMQELGYTLTIERHDDGTAQ